jgi:hypothetical protein
MNTLHGIGPYSIPSYASTSTFNTTSDPEIENNLRNNQNIYAPENLQRIRAQLLQLSSVTDDLSHALAALSLTDRGYITKHTFNRKINGWSRIIDFILDTSVSIAYKDEHFQWPEDGKFEMAIENYTPYAYRAFDIITKGIGLTISQKGGTSEQLTIWKRQKRGE